MACSAVKHDRDITCEDVVVGYTLTLKCLTEDLRRPIIDAYNRNNSF